MSLVEIRKRDGSWRWSCLLCRFDLLGCASWEQALCEAHLHLAGHPSWQIAKARAYVGSAR